MYSFFLSLHYIRSFPQSSNSLSETKSDEVPVFTFVSVLVL